MTIIEVTKKMASLLYHIEMGMGIVYFEPSTYDDVNDMPKVKISGDEVVVHEFRVSRDGCEIAVRSDMNWYCLTLLGCLYTDEGLLAMGLLDLLREVYYNTPLAEEYGDFDDDFIEE